MEFILKIELGNEAMQSGADIAAALRKTAAHVERIDTFDGADIYDRHGAIRDENGNTVGDWLVRPERRG